MYKRQGDGEAGCPELLEGVVASLIRRDKSVCKGHWRRGSGWSGAVEVESCGLGRPLHHGDGRTLVDVHMCVGHSVRRERFFS